MRRWRSGWSSHCQIEITVFFFKFAMALASDTISLDRQTAEEYESFASRVLQRAQKESKEIALTWLVVRRPAAAVLATEVAGIDLVVAGGCEALIEECGELCIDAVQVAHDTQDSGFGCALTLFQVEKFTFCAAIKLHCFPVAANYPIQLWICALRVPFDLFRDSIHIQVFEY